MARPFLDPVQRVEAPKVDFVQIMVDLYNAGVNPNRVAEYLDIDASTARGWERGREPRYSYGASLLLLHARFMRKRSSA